MLVTVTRDPRVAEGGGRRVKLRERVGGHPCIK